eukprot:NODE_4548_length_772_cov_28.404651_g4389_i0.p1 GENE.NODE_4548_length_772_cov_28.404651_g4389_i0~~NODE_4548_length_772_cov_28.404651_g4389_i0.p1  ORF type:complete len:240 (-),score=81.54 NODE_4548_length_772_cov_28.404651_g4389_i0:53-700(-)
MALEMEVAACVDQPHRFRDPKKPYTVEVDAEMQRQYVDMHHEIRRKWLRVQLALDGPDSTLRARARKQVRDTIEGKRVHMVPPDDSLKAQMEAQPDLMHALKRMAFNEDIDDEDINKLVQLVSSLKFPDEQREGGTTDQPAPPPDLTFESLYEALETEAKNIQPVAESPLSEDELAHYRRLISFEMQQDTSLVDLLGASTDENVQLVLQDLLARL